MTRTRSSAWTFWTSRVILPAFDQDVRVPGRRFSIGPRLDYAINDNNTLVARYNFSRNTTENGGVGGFTLPSRATDSSNINHEMRFTESMIINPKTVNETRFSYEYAKRETVGTTPGAGIIVSGAFNGGGSQIANNFNKARRWELNNATTTSWGRIRSTLSSLVSGSAASTSKTVRQAITGQRSRLPDLRPPAAMPAT